MHKRSDPVRSGRVLAALLVALGVAGCATEERSAERDTIVIHTWRTLTRPPEEPWSGPRTALYTYVLVGDVGGNDAAGLSYATLEARRALDELLKEVQAGQPVASIADKELLVRVNQFCVPVRGQSSGRLTSDLYDFDLASSYLNRMRLVALPADMTEHLSRGGPFLIGTRKPLAEIVVRAPDGALTIDTQSPVLMMDLSGMHPKSMPAYVKAYKEAVRSIDPGRSAMLQPLGPRIASEVLKLNEALPFVAEAYAGTQKRFTAISAPQ